MHVPVCSIHRLVLAPLGGGCARCVRERCARLSDKIMRELRELSELGLAAVDCNQDGSPDALGSDSTRHNDLTLVKV